MKRGTSRSGIPTFLVTVGLALVMTACGGSSTYSANGLSFDYPKSWRTVLAPASTAGQTGTVTRVGVGIDPADVVVVVSTQLAQPADPQQISQTEQSVIQALSTSASRKGATVRGPDATTLGGFDGIGLTILGLPLGRSVVVDSRVVVVIRDNVEYLLNCQSTPSHADEIGKGCRQVIDSFSVG